jgi:hypothetical protein
MENNQTPYSLMEMQNQQQVMSPFQQQYMMMQHFNFMPQMGQ